MKAFLCFQISQQPSRKVFMKNAFWHLLFCFIHHGEEIKAEVPFNVKAPQTSLTEGTEEEEIECCFLSDP
jgi:hypothetical protein